MACSKVWNCLVYKHSHLVMDSTLVPIKARILAGSTDTTSVVHGPSGLHTILNVTLYRRGNIKCMPITYQLFVSCCAMLRHIIVSYDSSNLGHVVIIASRCSMHKTPERQCLHDKAGKSCRHMLNNCVNNYTTMTQIVGMHKTAQRSQVHGSPACEQLPCSAWPCWPAHGFWPWPGLVCRTQAQANMHASSKAKQLHKSKFFAPMSCSNKCSKKQML